MASRYFIPGATTIGVVFKDGVILASEKRYAYGYFVLSRSVKKVFKITDTIGAACAGLVSDMQSIIQEVRANMKLHEFETGRPCSVRAVAKLTSQLLFYRRLFPLLTQTLVAGVDDEGPSLYVLDPLGSVIKDDYAVVGSGSEISIGVLEAEYKPGMSVEDSRNLVVKSMRAAMARDAASGDGIDILTITTEKSWEEYIPVR
ncbi:MAG: proteasome subunit beta [Candidatus Bathyarchaeota archaeon B24]|nr:MAG: proteasome subunit beta [Candidatus Bathyarchaeota archaeon B24]RLI26221.1 MAG: proteasome endopeptidase complex, archaeal, beta subunit [Candidatus Bathyarchaeota archaeon]